MDELFGLVIFAVVAVLGLVSKFQNKKREEERQNAPRRVNPQDLPEATRRMLFGDTAEWSDEEGEGAGEERSPGAEQPPPIRMAQPRAGAPRPTSTVAPERPEHRRAVPVMPQRPVHTPVAPDIAQQRAQVDLQKRRQAQARQEALQRQEARQRQAAELKEAQARMQRAKRAQQRIHESSRRTTAKRARGRAFIGGAAGLRRAIILSELLGPPKALRQGSGAVPPAPGDF